MKTERTRVLVVDDHAAWRNIIRSTIGHSPRLCVVGEAADGLQSIQMTQELLPDLLLLDIGLPNLNGLEVTRRIVNLSPRTKLLIVSENRSVEIAEKVFRIGAHGYVLKSDTATELLTAVDAVLDGKRFIGTHLLRNRLRRS